MKARGGYGYKLLSLAGDGIGERSVARRRTEGADDGGIHISFSPWQLP
jgi:hypothetical protein